MIYFPYNLLSVYFTFRILYFPYTLLSLYFFSTTNSLYYEIPKEFKFHTFFILFLATLKNCTFTKTGKSHHVDVYWQCTTCDMGDGYSICTTCIKICHFEHDVTYVRYGSHFCDCGEKGERSCKSLKSK